MKRGRPQELEGQRRVNPRTEKEVEAFIIDNGIDEKAATALRELDQHTLRVVIDEGPLSGRNVNAVLTGRIRRAKETGHSGSPLAESVATFIQANGLDNHAAADLQEQPLAVQSAVIEEGPLTGRNPNAVLRSRIRRILDGGSGGARGPSAPSALSEVAAFVQECGIDAAAQRFLEEQPLEVQRAVIQEGPLTGRNASAVLKSRIQRVLEQGFHDGGRDDRNAVMSLDHDVIARFSRENHLDSACTRVLEAQPPHIAQAVIEEGPVLGRNPSAVLMSRIRRVSEGAEDGEERRKRERQEAPEAWHSSPNGRGQRPRSGLGDEFQAKPIGSPSVHHTPNGRGQAQHGGDTGDVDAKVQAFIDENGLDEYAVQLLQDQPDDVLLAVVNEGPVTGRILSSVLARRIQRIVEQGRYQPPPSEPQHQGQSAAVLREQKIRSRIKEFVMENGCDEPSANHLMSQPLDVQEAVLEEGFLSGRNTSAVLMSRIKRIQQGASVPTSTAPAVSSSTRQRLDFIRDNGLDEAAAANLESQSWEVQQQVFAEGSLIGRNPSAVLTSRIRRLLNQNAGAGHRHQQQPENWARPAPIYEPSPQRCDLPPPPPKSAPLPEAEKVRWLVAKFVTENRLNEVSLSSISAQPLWLQLAVLDEGPILGASNPDAVLESRIRRASRGPPPPPQEPLPAALYHARPPHPHPQPFAWSQQPPPPTTPRHERHDQYDHAPRSEHGGSNGGLPHVRQSSAGRGGDDDEAELSRFVQDNHLDSSAEHALRIASRGVRRAVMDEGPITGRKTSAILLSRLRRVQAP